MADLIDSPARGYGNPFIDALVLGGKKWSGPIKVWFGDPGDWAGTPTDWKAHYPYGDMAALTWTADEKATFNYAMGLFSSVCNVSFQLAHSRADANIVWWKGDFGANLNVPSFHDKPLGDQIWGAFNANFELNGVKTWNYRNIGGDGLHTVLNSIGVGLGLTHTADAGEDGDSYPGGSFLFTFEQGIWTVMSSGDTGLEGGAHDTTYGAQGGLGAFDIAALQAMYGANTSARLGNDVYALPMSHQQGTGWQGIWDAGGIDTITGQGSPLKVSIDLREASLNPQEKYAGGHYSARIDISGGFTIARGTVIENAIGGTNGDDLFGNHAGNSLWGGGGHDKLYGYDGNDVLYGEDGNDSLYGGLGNDLVDAGTTHRGGTEGAEFAHGDEGNDTVLGGAGGHSLFGEAGDDTIIDTAGNNDLNGHEGNDFIKGGSGRDRAWGGVGDDRVSGGSDNDYLYGGDGNDTLFGESDVDSLYGDTGNDRLHGGNGADFLEGGSGDDILYGGAHIDRYTGGAGKDVFVLDSRPSRSALPDKFLDFDPRYDTIRLDKTYYKISKKLLSKNKLKADAFTFGSRAQDREDRIVVDKKAKKIYFDKDGTGGSAQILIAELDKNALKGMSYRDFDIG